MTDDFHLFNDAATPADDRDADVALITAYLARELSPLQILAVEERLASDPLFRATVQPILDAWAAPVASLGGEFAGSLTDAEKERALVRFDRERATKAASIVPSFNRRISMKRIAAVLGISALPMLAVAQAVVYSANHPEAPAHAVAARIVSTLAPAAQSASTEVFVSRNVGDARQRRELTGATESLGVAGRDLTQTRQTSPDRKRIAQLVKDHHAAVARGDTVVDYVVLVLDATDKYLWSTYGSGALSIDVGGDKRTVGERLAYNREYQAELLGANAAGKIGDAAMSAQLEYQKSVLAATRKKDSATPRADSEQVITLKKLMAAATNGGRNPLPVAHLDANSIPIPNSADGYTVRGKVAGVVAADSARDRAKVASVNADSLLALRAKQMAAASGYGPEYYDSVLVMLKRQKAESLNQSIAARKQATAVSNEVAARKVATVAAATAGAGRRGGRGASTIANVDSVGPYTASLSGPQLKGRSNQAYGLQDAVAGESGIQGLASKSVASADTYRFAAGELAPRSLQVMVVHLIQGANWRGR